MASVERGREQPKWRTDGKELFYLVPDGKIMATPVTIGLNFDSGAPIALFQANPREMVVTSEQFSYDVSGDGQKFLINTQLKTALTGRAELDGKIGQITGTAILSQLTENNRSARPASCRSAPPFRYPES
jgi:hypothetical protein